MEYAKSLASQVMEGKAITRDEALRLYNQPLRELCREADRIRRHFCSNGFDLCAIVNAKSGRCSENCRFCAQSGANRTGAQENPLLDEE